MRVFDQGGGWPSPDPFGNGDQPSRDPTFGRTAVAAAVVAIVIPIALYALGVYGLHMLPLVQNSTP